MKGNKTPIIYFIIIILVVIVSVGFDYLIATSDLPDWFKFALLQNRKVE